MARLLLFTLLLPLFELEEDEEDTDIANVPWRVSRRLIKYDDAPSEFRLVPEGERYMVPLGRTIIRVGIECGSCMRRGGVPPPSLRREEDWREPK